MSRAGSGQSGSFALSLAAFAEKTTEAIDASLREIIIEVGSSVIRMSPVGNPEIWAANVTHRSANKAQADAYDAHVEVRNVITVLTPGNFTKSGNLKRNVKYAKPLTKTERDQNFNVNGLVAGKDYVGGRFRANWHLSINVVENVTFDEVDPGGQETIAALVSAVSDFTAGQTAYLINNLPYAIPLEYGHSQQAPGGMVRITVARFQQIVDDAIRNNQV
ncbi:hypothetical protein [Pseudomonas sp.]|uniref:hypothetical protein n=1 Tax=Pseudomonas sp. TaxID=306 RepID=UPI0032671DD6